MKNLFKGYYRLDEEDFKTLWKNAIFIFDTNVLLNLYRYQASTSKTLFDTIEQLSDRIWIPYHVGLEFQRNRLTIIAEQNTKYSEVRNIVSKSITHMETELNSLQLKERHSHINPDKLMEQISRIKSTYFEELKALEEKSISVSSRDEIREKIDALFKNKIGNQPNTQQDLDAIFAEGKIRYENLIPPGYRDSVKSDDKTEGFTYGGFMYKRKYGDLIVWKQILEHAKEANLKDIIFVTDDNKSDWWWKVDSNGPKTIGARPELIDEIYNAARVERFHIYNTEGFLKYAREQLEAKVTEDAIKEVRELSVSRREHYIPAHSFANLSRSAEDAVFNWLTKNYNGVSYNNGFPDLIAYEKNQKYGFEVVWVPHPEMILNKIDRYIFKSLNSLQAKGFDEINLVFVTTNPNSIEQALEMILERDITLDDNLRVIIGTGLYDEEKRNINEFVPYATVNLGNKPLF